MAHTSIGFKGTVNQVAWANLMANAAPHFMVAGLGYWAPTAVAGADRTVRIAAGLAWACGVQDATDGSYDVAFDPNPASSDRYDLLVAVWRWTVSGGSVDFEVIKGTAGAGVPAVTALTRNPGTRYDGLIAVVRVRPSIGSFASTDITDCRVRGGAGGDLVASSVQHVGLLDLPITGRLWLPASGVLPERSMLRTSTGWRGLDRFLVLSGPFTAWSTPVADDNARTLAVTAIPDPGPYPYQVRTLAGVEITTGAGRADTIMYVDGYRTWDFVRGGDVTFHKHADIGPPMEGARNVIFSAYRIGGGSWVSGLVNAYMTCEVLPT